MRKIAVLFTTSLLFAVACSEEQETTQIENPIAQPIFEASDTSGIQEGPKIEFKEEVFDFGTIMQGDSVFHSFEFVNTGDAPLMIQSATAGCGCTIPKPPADPIKPGDTGKIEVIFNSKGKRGKISKDVNVLTTARDYPYIVKLKGEVLVEEETEE